MLSNRFIYRLPDRVLLWSFVLSDEVLKFTVAAIAAGWVCSNDPDGRFMYEHDGVTLVYRDHRWIASDGVDDDRFYNSLQKALESEF
jgi:hypothetical protein